MWKSGTRTFDGMLTDRASALYGLFCCACRLQLVIPVWQVSCGDRLCANCYSDLLAGLSTNPSGSFQCTSCLIEVTLGDCFRDRAVEDDLTNASIPCPHLGCSWSGSSLKYEEHVGKCGLVSNPTSEKKDQRNLTAESFHDIRKCFEDLPSSISVEEEDLIYNLPVRRSISGVNRVLTQLTHIGEEVLLSQKSVYRSSFVGAQCLYPADQTHSELNQKESPPRKEHSSGKKQNNYDLDSESQNFTGKNLVLPDLLLAPEMVEQDLGSFEQVAAPLLLPPVHLTFAQLSVASSGPQQVHTQNLEVLAMPPPVHETTLDAHGCPSELVTYERSPIAHVLNVVKRSQEVTERLTNLESLLAKLQDVMVQAPQCTT